ncbi:MAG TPA: hypothetical protein PKA00_16010 [Saprospiraceae bacterium]|nr:hypothetical protein [Saprospiraceae bacterium]HMQ84420.1 hypothetical protein [Saprospiraceae bacterium]
MKTFFLLFAFCTASTLNFAQGLEGRYYGVDDEGKGEWLRFSPTGYFSAVHDVNGEHYGTFQWNGQLLALDFFPNDRLPQGAYVELQCRRMGNGGLLITATNGTSVHYEYYDNETFTLEELHILSEMSQMMHRLQMDIIDNMDGQDDWIWVKERKY